MRRAGLPTLVSLIFHPSKGSQWDLLKQYGPPDTAAIIKAFITSKIIAKHMSQKEMNLSSLGIPNTSMAAACNKLMY